MKRVAAATATVAAGSVGGAALLALFMVTFASRSTVAGFGSLSAIYSIALLTSDAADFGSGFMVILRSNALSARAVDRRTVGLLLSRTVVHVVLLPIYVIVAALQGDPVTGALTVLASYLFSVRALFQARERAQGIYLGSSLLIILERSGAIIALLLLPEGDPRFALLALVIGSAIAIAPETLRIRWQRGGLQPFAQHIRALPAGLSSLGGNLSLLEVPIVVAAGGALVGGIYAVPARLLNPITFLSLSISAVLLKELPGRPKSEVHALVRNVVLLVVVVVATVGASIAVLAPTLLPAVLGPGFRAAVLPVQIFCVTALVVAVNQILQVALQSTGELHFAARATLVGTVAYLGAIGLAARLGGPVPAVAAGLLTQTALLAVLGTKWRNERTM